MGARVRERERGGKGGVWREGKPGDKAILVDIKFLVVFKADFGVATHKDVVIIRRRQIGALLQNQVQYRNSSLVRQTVDECFCCLYHLPPGQPCTPDRAKRLIVRGGQVKELGRSREGRDERKGGGALLRRVWMVDTRSQHQVLVSRVRVRREGWQCVAGHIIHIYIRVYMRHVFNVTVGSLPWLMTFAVVVTLDSAATASLPCDASLDSVLFVCAAESGGRHGCMRTLTAAAPLHADMCVFFQYRAELMWPLLLPPSEVVRSARVRAGMLGHCVWGSMGISNRHLPASAALLWTKGSSSSLLLLLMAAAPCHPTGVTAACRSTTCAKGAKPVARIVSHPLLQTGDMDISTESCATPSPLSPSCSSRSKLLCSSSNVVTET